MAEEAEDAEVEVEVRERGTLLGTLLFPLLALFVNRNGEMSFSAAFVPALGCGLVAPASIVANRAFLMPQIENGAFFEPLGHFFEDKKMPHGFGHFWAFFQDSGEKLLKNLFSKISSK